MDNDIIEYFKLYLLQLGRGSPRVNL